MAAEELKNNQSASEFFQEKYGLTENQLIEMNRWKVFRERIKTFCIKNNLDTFQTIFGEDEGLRLLKHFRSDCKEDFTKFSTYLVLEQYNDLLVYIIKNY